MLITLKTLLHTLLLPPGGPLLLATLGAWLIARVHAGARTRRVGWVLLVGGLASLWLLSVPVVADALTRVAERCPALDLTRPVQAQAIVILGGEDARADAPEYGFQPAVTLDLLGRVNYGAFIARRTGLPVLVTGTPIEAEAMRVSLARDFQIDARWVENRSRDTFQNAAFSAKLLKPEGITHIVLVTDAMHEWRARQEFASAGFDVVPAPVGVFVPRRERFVPGLSALRRSTAALYELLGDAVRVTLAALHLRRQDA
jgi:uncharacterized SAM-binding protein YcdF (DUF218 family)